MQILMHESEKRESFPIFVFGADKLVFVAVNYGKLIDWGWNVN